MVSVTNVSLAPDLGSQFCFAYCGSCSTCLPACSPTHRPMSLPEVLNLEEVRVEEGSRLNGECCPVCLEPFKSGDKVGRLHRRLRRGRRHCCVLLLLLVVLVVVVVAAAAAAVVKLVGIFTSRMQIMFSTPIEKEFARISNSPHAPPLPHVHGVAASEPPMRARIPRRVHHALADAAETELPHV